MSDDTISDESEPVVDETDGGGGMTGDADGAGYSAVGDAGPQVCEMITIEGAEVTHVEGPSPRHGSDLRPQADAPGLGMTLREDIVGAPFVDVRA